MADLAIYCHLVQLSVISSFIKWTTKPGSLITSIRCLLWFCNFILFAATSLSPGNGFLSLVRCLEGNHYFPAVLCRSSVIAWRALHCTLDFSWFPRRKMVHGTSISYEFRLYMNATIKTSMICENDSGINVIKWMHLSKHIRNGWVEAMDAGNSLICRYIWPKTLLYN